MKYGGNFGKEKVLETSVLIVQEEDIIILAVGFFKKQDGMDLRGLREEKGVLVKYVRQ
jgi:hypothetical protein